VNTLSELRGWQAVLLLCNASNVVLEILKRDRIWRDNLH